MLARALTAAIFLSAASFFCFSTWLYLSAGRVEHVPSVIISNDGPKFRKDDQAQEQSKSDPEYINKYLRYATFGDSWTSGVNYGGASEKLEYDYPNGPEVCQCRRVNEAWPVLLRDDVNNITNTTSPPDWTGNRLLDLDFRACFGSYFEDIPGQVAGLDQTHVPEFATLMVGGNPGGFPDLLLNCVYWPERSKEYGPQYPDPGGECRKAIDRCKEHIDAQWFVEGIQRSISEILTEPRIRINPEFKLFILGYADLFNEEDDACDEISFGVWGDKKPLLTKELRKELNSIVDMGRKLYRKIVNGPLFGDKVQFVDINDLFDGHRFCERTENGTIEQQNGKSWLYNFNWPACTLITEDNQQQALEQAELEMNPPDGVHNESWPVFCRNCGSLTMHGEFTRPFHPKPIGHMAIKDLLIKNLASTLGRKSVAS